ncbi:hypothetical protein D3C75_1195990 [compost metagenome]
MWKKETIMKRGMCNEIDYALLVGYCSADAALVLFGTDRPGDCRRFAGLGGNGN